MICMQNLFSFLQTVTYRLVLRSLRGREEKRKEKKTSIDKAVGKGYAAALCKKFFLDSCII